MTINNQLEHILQLPDLRFTKWCEKEFSINRGVYNTIDERLYEAGYLHVQDRRKAIVSFLRQYAGPADDRKYYKFGPGKLSGALHRFSE